MNKPSALSAEAEVALIQRLVDHVTGDVAPVDADAAYDAFLDDIYADNLKGPFEHLSPSRILKEMSPTDYRCGMADFTDSRSDEWFEIGGSYYDRREVEAAREAFVDDLRDELAAAEAAAEVYEDRDETNIDEGEAVTLRATIARLEAEIDAAERHSF